MKQHSQIFDRLKSDREKFQELLSKLLGAIPYTSGEFRLLQYRSPKEQARLWRQGRSRVEIDQTIKQLKDSGGINIASLIEKVGPQKENIRVTSALPGFSWHQYYTAVDFLIIKDKKYITDEKAYLPIAEAARNLGLTSGFWWASKDLGHVQYHKASPRTYFSLLEIDAYINNLND